MTKLITIILRWMRRDRKRTLLTFFSVLLAMYLMCFLGLYFCSAVSMMRSYKGFSEGRYHVAIQCDSIDQAEKLMHNTAVSEAAFSAGMGGMFYDKFIRDYQLKFVGGKAYFPQVLINGKSEAEPYSGTVGNGDIFSLIGAQGTELKGRFPENGDEITVSSDIADLYGLGIGSKLELKYEVLKGRLEYHLQTLPQTARFDDEGRPMYEDYKEPAEEDFTEYKDSWLRDEPFWNSHDIFRAMQQMTEERFIYSVPSKTPGMDNVYTFRARLSDEKAESSAKTYTVVGWTMNAGSGFRFSPQDSFARQFFTNSYADFRCRIKEGLDADGEAAQMCESVGLIADGLAPDGRIVKSYSTNDDLLFWEGRAFGNSEHTLFVYFAAIAAVAVFVFFARLIVNNAFELSSAYRAGQYGALKTVGTSDRQIFVMIMTECLIYILTALPAAIGLAVLTGKLIMSKIMDIKIFDVMYGPGVTDKFFSLELIPGIMAGISAVAVFSIIMSGYACAVRIRKLSPIEAFKGVKSKAKPRRSRWLSRRLFGFAAGYAARNAFKHKMHGGITMLAAIVSGTLIITLGSVLYGIDRSQMLDRSGLPDFRVYLSPMNNGGKPQDTAEEYQRLKDSGLFERIEPEASRYIYTQGEQASEALVSVLTEEFYDWYRTQAAALDSLGVTVEAVTREQFDALDTDLTYDQLLASDGVLLCSLSRDADGLRIFKEGIKEIKVPLSQGESGGEAVLPVSGYFTVKEDSEYSLQGYLPAIVPIERADALFTSLDEAAGNEGNEFASFDLWAAPDKEQDAAVFLTESYTDVMNDVSDQLTAKRIAEALKFAGLSLAGVIFAAALINLVSTSAAGIVNRRRELSMLRACGMPLKQLLLSLVTESAFYSLLTSAVSAVLGGLAGSFLLTLINRELAGLSGFSWKALLTVFGLTMLLMLASYLPTLISMSRKPISHDMTAM